MGFGVWGLGFGVWGLGCRVLGFRVWAIKTSSPQVKIYAWVRVWGIGFSFRVPGGCRVSGFGV